MEKLVEEVLLKLPRRSSEEVAYRVNLYLSKLTKADEEKILKSVGVHLTQPHPSYYVHFEHGSKGSKDTRAVKEISPELPTRDSLSKSVYSRKGSRGTSQVRDESTPNKQSDSTSKPLKLKLEEDDSNSAALGKRSSTQQRPDLLQSEESSLTRKLNHFVERLKSDDRKDVEENARMLARFVQHFACNFSVDVQQVMAVVEQQVGDINIDKVRAAFVKSLAN